MASVALCEAEKDLIFAGFIAFECLVRKDSALVIGALNESGHKVLCFWENMERRWDFGGRYDKFKAILW